MLPAAVDRWAKATLHITKASYVYFILAVILMIYSTVKHYSCNLITLVLE